MNNNKLSVLESITQTKELISIARNNVNVTWEVINKSLLANDFTDKTALLKVLDFGLAVNIALKYLIELQEEIFPTLQESAKTFHFDKIKNVEMPEAKRKTLIAMLENELEKLKPSSES